MQQDMFNATRYTINPITKKKIGKYIFKFCFLINLNIRKTIERIIATAHAKTTKIKYSSVWLFTQFSTLNKQYAKYITPSIYGIIFNNLFLIMETPFNNIRFVKLNEN